MRQNWSFVLMVLPNFLGIGVPRAGSTWLYKLLSAHPQVCMSTPVKEVHFFDRYYDRGVRWYEGFFPDRASAQKYKAIGEFTPQYLFSNLCRYRISKMGSIEKFVVVLRHPVHRVISNYHHRVFLDNYRDGLVRFCQDHPNMLEWSRYAEPLARYFGHFGEERFLILIYEGMTQDVVTTRQLLARHLNVAEGGFRGFVSERKVNERLSAGRPYVAAVVSRIRRLLRNSNSYWAISALRGMGMDRVARRVVGAKPFCAPSAGLDEINWLFDALGPEVERTEALLGRPIPQWRCASAAETHAYLL